MPKSLIYRPQHIHDSISSTIEGDNVVTGNVVESHPEIVHTSEQVADLQDLIRSGYVNIYSNPDLFSGIPKLPIDTTRILVEKPQSSEEQFFLRGGSSHNVTTARIGIFTARGGEFVSTIALKRHPRPNKASQELANSRNVLRKGFYTTIPVIAAIPTREERSGYFLSIFDPNLRSADRINFKSLSRNDKWSFLSNIATLTAHMHEAGIYHFDPQLKNIAVRLSDGRIYFFDLEKINLTEVPIAVTKNSDYVLKSIKPLVRSLRLKGFWAAIPAESQSLNFLTYFIKPYLTSLRETYSTEEIQGLSDLLTTTFKDPKLYRSPVNQ